jgi:hypothetical protein
MVIMVAIPAALFAVVGAQARAESDRADLRRAELLAQAGVAHATSLMRGVVPGVSPTFLLLGSDGAAGGNNDGLLIGHPGLTTGNQIPSTGVELPGMGRYYVRIIEDEPNVAADVLAGTRIGGNDIWADGGTNVANYASAPVENNDRLLMQCLGVTRDGSRAVVNIRLRRDPAPGLTIGGPLDVLARVNVTGACGDIHANGIIRDTRGNANWGSSANYPSATIWSSTSTIPSYFLGTKLQNQPARGMPSIESPISLCPATNRVIYDAMSRTDRTQTVDLDAIADGTTICVYGNVIATCKVKCQNPPPRKSSPATPRVLSIVASGSIRVLLEGAGWMTPAHPAGYQFLAGGDLDLTESGTHSLTLGGGGSTFCKSQLRLDTSISSDGQMVCQDSNNPSTGPTSSGGSVNFRVSGAYQGDFITTSTIGKSTTISFNCGGTLANLMQVIASYPSIGR